MDARESLGVLGLEEGATRTEVEAAFTRLRALHRLTPESVPQGKELWRLLHARNELLGALVPVLRPPRPDSSPAWRRPFAASACLAALAAAMLAWALQGAWSEAPAAQARIEVSKPEPTVVRKMVTAYSLKDGWSGQRPSEAKRLELTALAGMLRRAPGAQVRLLGCVPVTSPAENYEKCSGVYDLFVAEGIPRERLTMGVRYPDAREPVLAVAEYADSPAPRFQDLMLREALSPSSRFSFQRLPWRADTSIVELVPSGEARDGKDRIELSLAAQRALGGF